jgi:endonuclease-8
MPEGDTIFRAARALHRALAGTTIVRFESVYPALNDYRLKAIDSWRD